MRAHIIIFIIYLNTIQGNVDCSKNYYFYLSWSTGGRKYLNKLLNKMHHKFNIAIWIEIHKHFYILLKWFLFNYFQLIQITAKKMHFVECFIIVIASKFLLLKFPKPEIVFSVNREGQEHTLIWCKPFLDSPYLHNADHGNR